MSRSRWLAGGVLTGRLPARDGAAVYKAPLLISWAWVHAGSQAAAFRRTAGQCRDGRRPAADSGTPARAGPARGRPITWPPGVPRRLALALALEACESRPGGPGWYW
jgi:hypothetical protein